MEDVERLIADSPAALLVAERDGEIVGVLIAAWDGWRGNMYRLAVREGAGGRGSAWRSLAPARSTCSVAGPAG